MGNQKASGNEQGLVRNAGDCLGIKTARIYLVFLGIIKSSSIS